MLNLYHQLLVDSCDQIACIVQGFSKYMKQPWRTWLKLPYKHNVNSCRVAWRRDFVDHMRASALLSYVAKERRIIYIYIIFRWRNGLIFDRGAKNNTKCQDMFEHIDNHHWILIMHGTCIWWVNSSPPGQNSRHFADDIFRCFLWMKRFAFWLKFHWSPIWHDVPFDNSLALAKIMARRRIGDKPLSEPMLSRFTGAFMQH